MTKRLKSTSGQARRVPPRAFSRGLEFGRRVAGALGAGPRGIRLRGDGISRSASHPQWKFVFVNHVTTNPFFVPTQYGIADACSVLGCTYQWTGSQTSVASEMVNAMDAAITAKADAIAVSLVDLHAFNEPTKRRSKPESRCSPTTPTQRATIASPISARISTPPVRRRPPDRRAGRRGPGRRLHRDAGAAQHPAASRRRQGRDQGVGQEDRARGGRHRPDGQRGSLARRRLLCRAQGHQRHVRGRCRQHDGGGQDDGEIRAHAKGVRAGGFDLFPGRSTPSPATISTSRSTSSPTCRASTP